MAKRLLLSFVVLIFFAGACASDGRELRDPPTDEELQERQTTTTRPTPPVDQEKGDGGFSLSSPDFTPGGAAPLSVRCDNGDNSKLLPTLVWDNVPEGTQELAVSLYNFKDIEEPQLMWLTAGIPPEPGELTNGRHSSGNAIETLNDWGNLGYGDPCIESLANGEEVDFQFKIYALSEKTSFSGGAPGNTSIDEVRRIANDSASVLMILNKVEDLPVATVEGSQTTIDGSLLSGDTPTSSDAVETTAVSTSDASLLDNPQTS